MSGVHAHLIAICIGEVRIAFRVGVPDCGGRARYLSSVLPNSGDRGVHVIDLKDEDDGTLRRPHGTVEGAAHVA